MEKNKSIISWIHTFENLKTKTSKFNWYRLKEEVCKIPGLKQKWKDSNLYHL